MCITDKVIWTELKLKVLESAMMLQDGYSQDEVIAKLLEVIELLDNTQPNGGVASETP
ncbi:hypothetical protein JMM81_12555 [Bacillus sp. V3B]|uniref:hypothetical protein n=1 Tax=Bacillus sp. V3B TaxID=2804915 RepID=UPI00210B3F93|nr:hypothetical protein [Bacillus sp. V3B]MCQ6275786.1 hypothetical protein [Bacillus sp. V3B]